MWQIFHSLRFTIPAGIYGWLLRIMRRFKITSPLDNSLVESNPVRIEGKYFARFGGRFGLFYQDGSRFFPQAAIEFNPKSKTWSGTVFIRGDPNLKQTVVVASFTDDLQALFDYYAQVHATTDKWVPIKLGSIPPGFCELDRVTIWLRSRPTA